MNDNQINLVEVPCNGCVRCCIRDAVRILPEEDPTQWYTEKHPWLEGQLMLAHKRTGECYYLGDQGCTIYQHRPIQCQSMDCRRIAKNYTFTEIRKIHPRMIPLWKKGRELLKEQKNEKTS